MMTVGWAAVLSLASLFLPSGNSWIDTLIWSFLVLTPVAGIPLACLVAVLKYRLYEMPVGAVMPERSVGLPAVKDLG